MGTTFYHGYPYPESSDSPDGASQIRALAEAVDADMWTIQVNIASITLSAAVAGNVEVTFPSAFGGTPLVVAVAEDSYYNVSVYNVTTTGFNVACRHLNNTAATTTVWLQWIAVGKP